MYRLTVENTSGSGAAGTVDPDHGVTFDLNPELTFSINKRAVSDFHALLYDSPVVKDNQGKIIITTKPRGLFLKPIFDNGFIGTFYEAYNNHRHLSLSPDDVWMSIITSLSLYVNSHAEEMRKVFVEHEGQIELVAHGGGNIYSADWNSLIDNLINQVDKKTKGATRAWLVPNFSTTTIPIATAAKVTMMAIFQKYFGYRMCLLCGIPKITLKGKIEDWQELQRKAAKLRELGQPPLQHWASLLDNVLGKFVDSYKGDVDKEFWRKVCHIEGMGSGPRYCAGWLNVFMPFTSDGNYVLDKANPASGEWCQIDTNDVPPSVVEVPVTVDDNGVEHNTKFIAGFLATSYNLSTNTVSPSIDWAIIDLPGEKKGGERGLRHDEWISMWKAFPGGLYYPANRL